MQLGTFTFMDRQVGIGRRIDVLTKCTNVYHIINLGQLKFTCMNAVSTIVGSSSSSRLESSDRAILWASSSFTSLSNAICLDNAAYVSK